MSEINEKLIHTHNVATEILDKVEDVLDKYDITVPSLEDEDREEDNSARLYGSTYSDLLDDIELTLLELCAKVKHGFEIVPYIYGGDVHDKSDCEMAEE